MHGACPEVSNGRRAIRVLGVKVGQLPLRLLLDLRPDAPQLLGQFRPVAWDILQHDLEDKTGHRVEVAGERLTAQPQGLQRN